MADVHYVPVDRYPTLQGQIIALRKMLYRKGENHKIKLINKGTINNIDGKKEYRMFLTA